MFRRRFLCELCDCGICPEKDARRKLRRQGRVSQSQLGDTALIQRQEDRKEPKGHKFKPPSDLSCVSDLDR